MSSISQIIDKYQGEVYKIEQYIPNLKRLLSHEKDIRKRNILLRRITLLQTERREILRDIKNMLPYISDDTQERYQHNQSN